MTLLKTAFSLLLFLSGVYVVSCINEKNDVSVHNQSVVFRNVAKDETAADESVCNSDIFVKDFSQDDRDSAFGIYKRIAKIRNKNPILDFLQTKHTDDSNKEFISKNLPRLLSYAYYGFSLLLVPFFILICSCCKCGCTGFYYTSEETKKMPLLILTSILAILILIASSFGIHYSNNLDASLKSLSCSGQTLFDQLSQGDLERKWIGLEPAISNLTAVSKTIAQSITNLPQVDNDHTNLDTYHQQFQSQVETYYDKSSSQTIINPGTGKDLAPLFIQVSQIITKNSQNYILEPGTTIECE